MAGWRWLLVVGALGAFIVWWMRRDLPESPRWFEIRRKTTDAEAAISAMEQAAMRELHLATLALPELAVVEPPRRMTLTESFSGIYAKRTIMLLIFQLPFVALPLLQASGPVAVFATCAVILGTVSLDVGLLGPRTTGQTLEEVAH
jgi:MFS family permease